MLSAFHQVTTNFEAWSLFGLIVFIGIGLTIILLVILEACGVIKSYKEGQIDAMNGKIKYKKEEQENGEIYWVEMDNYEYQHQHVTYYNPLETITESKKTDER